MAQPKPKKKRRSRSDPVRRAAALRREEARRAAAEERRKEQEATERREKLKKTARRLAVPALVGIGVVVAAIFLFRPSREVAGVQIEPVPQIIQELGYEALPEDLSALPDPACGTVESLTNLQFYADLRNGAVVLFYRSANTDAAAALQDLAAQKGSQVVVTANDSIGQPVMAVAWERIKGYETATDPGLLDFVNTYAGRVSNGKECPVPAA